MPHEETITIMQIRKANLKDMEVIMALIAEGRRKMIAEGNTHQWTEGHPARSVVEDDILRQDSYLMVNAAGTPVATFVLRKGPGPTYGLLQFFESHQHSQFRESHWRSCFLRLQFT